MRAVVEAGLLLVGTAGRWFRALPALATWYCLGWAAYTAGAYASVAIGAQHRTLATLVFVLGAIAQVVTRILMLHSLWDSLRTPRRLRAAGRAGDPDVAPATVFAPSRPTDVVIRTIAPFLAVCAVWGLVESWLDDLLLANILRRPTGGFDPDAWSVSLHPKHLGFYAGFAAAALAVRLVIAAARRRHPASRVLGVIAIGSEGLWGFASFVALVLGAQRLVELANRTAGMQNLWRLQDRIAAAIPRWHLPFGMTLPDALDRAWRLLVDDVLPVAWENALLPLVWLALAATVLGWHAWPDGDAVRDLRLGRPLAVLDRRSAFSGILRWATADLRDRWVPVLQSLRLVARTGLPFLAAFLVLATGLTLLEQHVNNLVLDLFGTGDQPHLVRWWPLRRLLVGLFATTVSTAFYVTAFDRVLEARAGLAATPLRVVRPAVESPVS